MLSASTLYSSRRCKRCRYAEMMVSSNHHPTSHVPCLHMRLKWEPSTDIDPTRACSMSSLTADCAVCSQDTVSVDMVGKVMVGTVSGGTRCIGTRSLRRYVFVMRGKTTAKLCVLRAELCSGGVSLACGAIRAGVVGCLRTGAVFTNLSFPTLQCHRLSAPCASVSSRGLSLPFNQSQRCWPGELCRSSQLVGHLMS